MSPPHPQIMVFIWSSLNWLLLITGPWSFKVSLAHILINTLNYVLDGTIQMLFCMILESSFSAYLGMPEAEMAPWLSFPSLGQPRWRTTHQFSSWSTGPLTLPPSWVWWLGGSLVEVGYYSFSRGFGKGPEIRCHGEVGILRSGRTWALPARG